MYVVIVIFLVSNSPAVAIAGYFINYAVDTRPGTSSATGAKFLAGAQGAFAVGRFTGTLLMKFFKPRYVFLLYMCGVVACLAASVTQRNNTGIGECHFFYVSVNDILTNDSQPCFS